MGKEEFSQLENAMILVTVVTWPGAFKLDYLKRRQLLFSV